MIRVECKFAASIGRFELEDYVRPVEFSVLGYTVDGDEVVMGRIVGDQLRLIEAEIDEISLFDICDNDSGGMTDLFTALFDENYNFHEEIDPKMETDYILFLWNAALHPSLAPYFSGIVETISDMLGKHSAVVVRRGVCQLTDRQLADLGFGRIAGTEFLFRHMGMLSPYNKMYPQGDLVDSDYAVDADDGQWVLENWDDEV
jgi:hypothetical protein